MDNKEALDKKLELLRQKYDHIGQDMLSYLDGLLYSRPVHYWEYIHLETLLSLQTPRTDFPDERIFICYHQITELYFNLILLELKQLSEKPDFASFMLRGKRIRNYFKNLTHSFDIMVEGMEVQQFLQFRMALLPASGFQSVQYRLIEMQSMPLIQMVNNEIKPDIPSDATDEDLYGMMYWKYGNLELKTGEKTLTLRLFEEKYDALLLNTAIQYKGKTLAELYRKLTPEERNTPELVQLMKGIDLMMNVFWPLSHYKSAVKYLHKDQGDMAATGGTNWQKYLPPRFQKRILLPELWSEEEIKEWGKAWVLELFKEKVESFWN